MSHISLQQFWNGPLAVCKLLQKTGLNYIHVDHALGRQGRGSYTLNYTDLGIVSSTYMYFFSELECCQYTSSMFCYGLLINSTVNIWVTFAATKPLELNSCPNKEQITASLRTQHGASVHHVWIFDKRLHYTSQGIPLTTVKIFCWCSNKSNEGQASCNCVLLCENAINYTAQLLSNGICSIHSPMWTNLLHGYLHKQGILFTNKPCFQSNHYNS